MDSVRPSVSPPVWRFRQGPESGSASGTGVAVGRRDRDALQLLQGRLQLLLRLAVRGPVRRVLRQGRLRLRRRPAAPRRSPRLSAVLGLVPACSGLVTSRLRRRRRRLAPKTCVERALQRVGGADLVAERHQDPAQDRIRLLAAGRGIWT